MFLSRFRLFVPLAVLILVAACNIRNESTPARPAAPVVARSQDSTTVQLVDSVYDFGKVEEGRMVEHAYRFRNTGQHPLEVYDVAASCGCTVAEKPQKPVLPGEMGEIKARFNTEKRPGQASKTLSVSSNAYPEFPILTLKGTVIGKPE